MPSADDGVGCEAAGADAEVGDDPELEPDVPASLGSVGSFACSGKPATSASSPPNERGRAAKSLASEFEFDVCPESTLFVSRDGIADATCDGSFVDI